MQCGFETWVDYYDNTRRHITEDNLKTAMCYMPELSISRSAIYMTFIRQILQNLLPIFFLFFQNANPILHVYIKVKV